MQQKTTAMLMFIIANAYLFAFVLTTEQIPQAASEWIVGLGLPPWGFLIVVNIILLIGGQFMEPSGLLVIVAPLVFPIAIQLGIDPIKLVRRQESVWKENYKGKELSNDQLIAAMHQNPKLIERPIVVKNGKAALGRPPENVLEIL